MAEEFCLDCNAAIMRAGAFTGCPECGCCEDCCACPPQDDSAADAYRDTLEGR